MTRLEDQATRARELVEERSQGLLGHAFSRVFSHLLNLDPHFDFDAAIALMPEVIQDNLAGCMDDHVDALVSDFAPEDVVVFITAEEDSAGGDDKEDDHDSAGGADRDDEDNTSS